MEERPNEPSLSSRYQILAQDRAPFLRRAREAAALTIPQLISQSDNKNTGSQDLPKPHQSMGSRGANNLMAKMLLTLLPVNVPFFRLQLDESVKREIQQQFPGTVLSDTEKTLAGIERSVIRKMETSSLRVKVAENLLHLTVTGNACIRMHPQGTRVFHLDSYVVDRDPEGNVMEIVTKESIDPLMLAAGLREAVGRNKEDKGPNAKANHVDLYTGVKRTSTGRFFEWQEVGDHMVPGMMRIYEPEELPYIAGRMYPVSGESYGRGHVELYMGDLVELDGLSKSISEGASSAAKFITLVNPAARSKLKGVDKAPNGAIFYGREGDLFFPRMDKNADFSVARSRAQDLEGSLGFAFLLNSTVQRQAERVTAEEIRFVARELEDTLGGVFSLLSNELQLPLVKLLMHHMQDAGELPKFDQDLIKPAIVTGLDAIGRGHDLSRFERFADTLQRILGPDRVQEWLETDDVITRVGTHTGVETDGLVKSKEQVAQERQQAMLAQLAQSGTGKEALKQLSENSGALQSQLQAQAG